MTGWVRDEQGRLKRETKPRMGRRLRGWDYCKCGYYVITIVNADRTRGEFGRVVVKKLSAGAESAGGGHEGEWLTLDEAKALGLNADEIEAKVEYSSLRRAIFNHFRRIGEFTPGLQPVYCAMMPDHLHLLLKVVD